MARGRIHDTSRCQTSEGGWLWAGTVETGHEFERYEEDADGVLVHFKGRAAPVRGKLMVGCDGLFSPVRRQCLADGPPDFGVRMLHCFPSVVLHLFAFLPFSAVL